MTEPHLALMRGNEDLAHLPADPRRFMAPAQPLALIVMYFIGDIALTVGLAIAWYWRIYTVEVPEVAVATAIVLGVIVTLFWVLAIWGAWGNGNRKRFYRAYRRFAASNPVPQQGMVVHMNSTESEGGVLERCWVEVELPDKRTFRARRHPRRATRDKQGYDITFMASQAPQFGDVVQVFTDPSGELPVLVLTTRRTLPQAVYGASV